eukprot:365753-Chlamydomonas_euryale.AAC.1
MVPGVPRRIAGKSTAPGWPSAPQLLPPRLPHRWVVKQPSLGKRGRNGNVLENQPRKGENDVCDFQGLRTHFALAASARWKLPKSHGLRPPLHTGALLHASSRPPAPHQVVQRAPRRAAAPSGPLPRGGGGDLWHWQRRARLCTRAAQGVEGARTGVPTNSRHA